MTSDLQRGFNDGLYSALLLFVQEGAAYFNNSTAKEWLYEAINQDLSGLDSRDPNFERYHFGYENGVAAFIGYLQAKSPLS